ncbi:hypothetical protein ATKI12_6624 [Kitasatospora sp. Ki12]
MSDTTPNAKGPAPIQGKPVTTEPTLVPASEVKPEDLGSLSLRYVDGQPQLVVSGGTFIPAGLTVVNDSGTPVAAYAASPLTADATNANPQISTRHWASVHEQLVFTDR